MSFLTKKKIQRIVALVTVAGTLSVSPAYAAISDDDWNDILNRIDDNHISVAYIDEGTSTIYFNDYENTTNTVDFQNSNGTARILTNVVTDADDDTSAASVAYVKKTLADGADSLWKEQDVGGTNVLGIKNDDVGKISLADSSGNARPLTGVYTDPSDKTSAANVGYVDQRYKESREHSYSVGAMAAAMAALPAPMYGGKGQTSWGIATGVFHGKTAVAAGLNYDVSDNLRLQAKAALQSGESMRGLGLGVNFGSGHPVASYNMDLKKLVVALSDRLDAVEAKNRQLMTEARQTRVRTTTDNYTNMYGHNFVVKQNGGQNVLYNLDGSRLTEAQLDNLAEDFYYNYGSEFDASAFQINPQGNLQYRDPESGEWIPGSEQSAVGHETISRDTVDVADSSTRPTHSSSTNDLVAAARGGARSFTFDD